MDIKEEKKDFQTPIFLHHLENETFGHLMVNHRAKFFLQQFLVLTLNLNQKRRDREREMVSSLSNTL